MEHVDITDPEIHEPKGVSAATSGEMYVADGAGSGSWQHTSTSTFGSMNIVNNSTGTAVTAAADATLNTDTDYVKVTAGWASGHLERVTFSTNKLVAPTTGHYTIKFWCSVKIPAINNFIGIKYAVNDATPYSLQKLVSQSATSNDYRNLFGSAVVALNAGDSVSIYVAATKNDTLVFEEAGMIMSFMHES